MKQSQLNKLIRTITICATAFIVLLVGIIVGQYIKLHKLNTTLADLQENIDNYNTARYNLSTDIENRSSSIYIEEYARNCLGLIEDDETYFDIK